MITAREIRDELKKWATTACDHYSPDEDKNFRTHCLCEMLEEAAVSIDELTFKLNVFRRAINNMVEDFKIDKIEGK
jgi:hypothetical protein